MFSTVPVALSFSVVWWKLLPSSRIPSRNHSSSGAGRESPRLRQVRFPGTPATRDTEGPPSTWGASGGTITCSWAGRDRRPACEAWHSYDASSSNSTGLMWRSCWPLAEFPDIQYRDHPGRSLSPPRASPSLVHCTSPLYAPRAQGSRASSPNSTTMSSGCCRKWGDEPACPLKQQRKTRRAEASIPSVCTPRSRRVRVALVPLQLLS